MSYWMARLESSHDPYASDEKNMESFFILVEELGDINTNECIIYDEMVEEAIKVYRRMANSHNYLCLRWKNYSHSYSLQSFLFFVS